MLTVPETIAALDVAALHKQSELDLLEAAATNFRSFQSAYVLFASLLTAKTGQPVAPNFPSIKAALESLPNA